MGFVALWFFLSCPTFRLLFENETQNVLIYCNVRHRLT